MSGGEGQGPYFTTWGPRDGLILQRDHPPALGVYLEQPPEAFPVGMAFPARWIRARRGPPAVTFRLQVGKVELEGEWICRGRQFVRLGEAAEEV